MATVKELEAKLAALQEENEKLKADPEPVNLVLPDAKFTPTIPYVPKKMVKIELFKDDYRYKEPLFVGINSRTWLVPRGVEVEVPDYVADFIEAQRSEEARIMRKVEAEEKEYQDKTASLGK